MKILIIGSGGFIGGHLKSLLGKNNEVWGADVIEASEDRYFQLRKDNTNFDLLFEGTKFDVCINASGNGSVPISLNRPVFDFDLNVTNTIKILDLIRLNLPECRFVNMSSAAVYGSPQHLPISEDTDLKPLSPYGWHKLYAEQICKEYYYLYNIKTINLRLFSVYGENLRKQLFWDTYEKSLRSSTIELFGTGHETRDFIYIKDLVTAVECVIREGLFNGESINVASGIETSIKEATRTFCNHIDPEISVCFNNIVKPGDPLNWKADIRILNSLGFTPQVSIEEGLKNTVAWLKEKK